MVGDPDPARHEMAYLTLSTDKARRELGWSPRRGVARAVDETMRWYRDVSGGTPARDASLAQIRSYARESAS